MKNKRSIVFSLLALFMLVAGLVMPASLGNPAPAQAAPGILKWSTVDTPGSFGDRADIVLRSEIDKLVVGPTGTTLLAIVTRTTVPAMQLYSSGSSGRSWGGSSHLRDAMLKEWSAFTNVWDAAIAPDDQKFWAVVSSSPTTNGPAEVWVTQDGGTTWELTRLANATGGVANNAYVAAISISPLYNGKRDIAVGIRNGGLGANAAMEIWGLSSSAFSSWKLQTILPPEITAANKADVIDLEFSPTYASDAALAVVFSDTDQTFFNIALRDIGKNDTSSWAFSSSVEIKDPASPSGASPGYNTIITADLELPADFSGQAASLRRAYVSFYSSPKNATNQNGIYRIDDNAVYVLMDTTNVTRKDISSIAYFGTYASGKLLAGEVFGDPCKATVPTWFTDSPTTCPIPCWYEALKPTTGAAGLCDNGYGNAQVGWSPDGTLAFVGTGSACLGPFHIPNNIINCAVLREWPDGYLKWVAWDESAFGISRNNGETWNQLGLIDTTISQFTDVAPTPDCKTIYLSSVNTGGSTSRCTASYLVGYDNTTTPTTCNVTFLGAICACATLTQPTVNYDVVATYDPNTCGCNYSISGNFTYVCDCAPGCPRVTPFTTTTGSVKCGSTATVTVSADCQCSACPSCTTNITEGCRGFDSVWRSSSNPTVESPLSAMPVGTYWERIFTHVTASDCTQAQSNVALLRLVPWCADPGGEVVGWAAKDTKTAFWSPDYGDYWAPVTVRNAIQDFTFESRTMLYFLSPGGLVQKMPYTGTAWSTSLPNYDSGINPAHTIAAMPDGMVLVGKAVGAAYAAALSLNMGTDNPTWTSTTSAGPFLGGNSHVAFDPKFDDNSIFYVADESATGSVYRNNPTAQLRWSDTDMMAAANGAVGCPDPDANRLGFTGIVLAYTGSALYASSQVAGAGVWRTIDDGTGKYGPLSSMPKPGIAWDKLNVGLSADVVFTAQPSALKACGCCTLATDTTLYAIDNRAYDPDDRTGMLWAFTDCLAKRGPSLVTDDKTLIGCDPVSGRAQEVNFCWEQLCLADHYDIEIAKDKDFTILVIDWTTEGACGGFTPADVTKPCAYFPAGGRASGASELALWGNLECGHTYYWRVKARHGATGQDIRSPWSDVRSFNVKAGLPVVASYNGLQLLAPANGMIGLPVKSPFFSWTPLGENTKYKFILAKDGNLTQIVKETEVTGTAYTYDGTLDYSTSYFWRVMALAPAPSDWSATFNFRTEAEPAAKTPSGTPTTGLWNQLALPMKAIGNWLASLNLKLMPALPFQTWAWGLIAICIILFILWLLVMIAISKPLRK